MNQKAEELGLKNTHFVTPHGLDQDEHYTTAHELAKITDYALNNKKFVQIVGTKQATVYINGNQKQINNTNELLGNLNGVDGVKTGFTNNAGRCLVTSTTRNGHKIICVVLGADTKKIRTADSIKLIEYAFSNYEYINIKEKIDEQFKEWKEENIKNIEIVKGTNEELKIKLGDLQFDEVPVNKNNIKDIKVQVTCKNTLQAPLQKNDIIGKIEVKVKEETITEVDLLLEESIQKKNIINYLQQFMTDYSIYLEQAIR